MTDRRVTIVTGTRADFGLLAPVIRACHQQDGLHLRLVVTGTHLLPPTHTIREIEAEFVIDASIPMQAPGEVGRFADARALAKGVEGIAGDLEEYTPHVLLVLGDRIEAFAAASAAAVAGVRVAHVHGGDRAEGVADESMRHAMSKLAHIHLPATRLSAQRLVQMGEHESSVHVVGSPAMDSLGAMPAMNDAKYSALGNPQILMLLHPTGEAADTECERATLVIEQCLQQAPTLALQPNHDPGRAGIAKAIEVSGVPSADHLPRRAFIGLLRRLRCMVGNSSAGLIEAAAIPLPAVNVGDRQSGRERADNVIDCDWTADSISAAIHSACKRPRPSGNHPYGDGQTGQRIAKLLATIDLDAISLRKRNTF